MTFRPSHNQKTCYYITANKQLLNIIQGLMYTYTTKLTILYQMAAQKYSLQEDLQKSIKRQVNHNLQIGAFNRNNL